MVLYERRTCFESASTIAIRPVHLKSNLISRWTSKCTYILRYLLNVRIVVARSSQISCHFFFLLLLYEKIPVLAKKIVGNTVFSDRGKTPEVNKHQGYRKINIPFRSRKKINYFCSFLIVFCKKSAVSGQ